VGDTPGQLFGLFNDKSSTIHVIQSNGGKFLNDELERILERSCGLF